MHQDGAFADGSVSPSLLKIFPAGSAEDQLGEDENDRRDREALSPMIQPDRADAEQAGRAVKVALVDVTAGRGDEEKKEKKEISRAVIVGPESDGFMHQQ